MNTVRSVSIALTIAALNAGALAAPLIAQSGARFEVSFSGAVHPSRITGRAYVALSRTSTAERGPIAQAGENGVPLFGIDIDQLSAGKHVVIDTSTFGHPVQSLRDLPAGEYWAQAFVNVYTKFARADGMADMFAKALTMGGTGLGLARRLLASMNQDGQAPEGNSPLNGPVQKVPMDEK